MLFLAPLALGAGRRKSRAGGRGPSLDPDPSRRRPPPVGQGNATNLILDYILVSDF